MQVRQLQYFVPAKIGQTSLSLLPPWHIYERTASYFVLSHGLKQVSVKHAIAAERLLLGKHFMYSHCLP